MATVDTHVHIASDDESSYPRQPSDRGSSWWRGTGYSAPEVLARVQAAGVERVVVAQAVGVYGYDNRYLLDSAAAHPGTLTAVVGVDMDGEDPAGALDGLAGRPGVAGVRLLSVFGGDGWIGSGRLAEVLEVAARDRLAVVLTVFGDGLGALRPAVADRPEVPVALDHCAFPTLVDGEVAPGEPVLGWADLPHVHLKVSSHLFNQLGGADPARLVDQLADRFGPTRLLWGSDYPQSEHESYGQLVELGRRAARHLDRGGTDAFFGANADRLFPARPLPAR